MELDKFNGNISLVDAVNSVSSLLEVVRLPKHCSLPSIVRGESWAVLQKKKMH
jgi:hypothetical protein